MRIGKRLLFAVTLILAGNAGFGASIPILNASFESPTVPLEDLAAPGATSWTTTGGTSTGIFPNLPTDLDLGGGVIAKRITNPNLLQLAFISAKYDPTGTTTMGAPVINEFSQVLTTNFLPGSAYQLSVGVTTSSVQPPSPGAKLRLELFYTLNNVRTELSSLIVSSDDASINNEMLKYFTFTTPVVTAGDAWANQPIGILVATTDNTPSTGGTFDFDNITLNTVPEPASAGIIAVAAFVIAVRRRKARRAGIAVACDTGF